jgi:hypothetical protein
LHLPLVIDDQQLLRRYQSALGFVGTSSPVQTSRSRHWPYCSAAAD